MQRLFKNKILLLSLILISLIVMFIVSINIGSIKVSLIELFNGLFIEYNPDVALIYDLRFPRVIIAMLAGAALALSGVLLQAALKNNLADPGIIGISSGAAFFSVLGTMLFPQLIQINSIFGFIGGIVAFVLVYTLAYKNGFSPFRLILVGLAIQALFDGFTSIISIGSTTSGVASIVDANISLKTWDDVYILLAYSLPLFITTFALINTCDLLALEDKTIRALGINVNFRRFIVCIVAVLLASIATSIVGIISFLGLLVPHLARILVGSKHKYLIPFSMLLGALIFLVSDTLGRTLMYPNEISPAVIMAILGGPLFIVLLRKSDIYGK